MVRGSAPTIEPVDAPGDYAERLQHAMQEARVDMHTLANKLDVHYNSVKKVLNGGWTVPAPVRCADPGPQMNLSKNAALSSDGGK